MEGPACGVRPSRGAQGLFGHQRDGAHRADPQLELLVRDFECWSVGGAPSNFKRAPTFTFRLQVISRMCLLAPLSPATRTSWATPSSACAPKEPLLMPSIGLETFPLWEIGSPLFEGASSYTSRLFEALFAGCIPVILSDHLRLPAADLAVRNAISALRGMVESTHIEKVYPSTTS